MIYKKINLVLVLLLLLSVSVFAQGVGSVITNDGNNVELTKQVVNQPITNKELNSGVEFNTEVIFKEKEVSLEIQSAIYDLRVKPSEIFSPVFSSVENLEVNTTIEDEKVVYNLVVKDEDKPIFREKEVIQPIFDLRVNKPIEFKLADNRIIVNDEQIIDYKNIIREKEVMPPIELEINSAITDGKVHNLKVVPQPELAEFKFIYKEKEVMIPVYSDFKIEDKKLNLINNGEVYYLRVNPPEIYSAIYDLKVDEPKIVVKELSLGIENEKAVYNLRVEEPAKILWLFPTNVESKYLIDPADGSAELVNSPWYITNEKIKGLNAVGYIK